MIDTIVVVSGYFNPLHAGHIQYLEGARTLGNRLVVIVNNDRQQLLKKHRIIMQQGERLRIASSLRIVDEAVLSIDDDRSVCLTLEKVALANTGAKIVFANGGDRDSRTDIPETEVCDRLGIDLRFGVGGTEKVNSSSDIIKELDSDAPQQPQLGSRLVSAEPGELEVCRRGILRCTAPLRTNSSVAFPEEHPAGRIRFRSGSRLLDWEDGQWKPYEKEGSVRWEQDELKDEDYKLLLDCLENQIMGLFC